MTRNLKRPLRIIALGAAVLVWGQIFSSAQAPAGGQAPAGAGGRGGRGAAAPATPAGPAPRTADGKPDMSGAWLGSFGVGLQNIQTSRVAGTQNRLIVEPADGRIPYKPEWAAFAANMLANNMFAEPELHCYLSGVPHIMYIQFGFQIVQHAPPGPVLFVWDFMNANRIVHMDGRPRLPASLKLFMGDAHGKWEGDTLVIETTNQNSYGWFDTAATPHSDQIHVVERFTMTDANNIAYEAVVTDPVAFTGPMKVIENFRRNPAANWEVMEFACIEGNKDNLHYPVSAGGPKPNQAIAAPDEFVTQRGGRGGAGGAPPAGGRGGAPGGAPPAGGGAPRGQQ
jgi:hypothetical protein